MQAYLPQGLGDYESLITHLLIGVVGLMAAGAVVQLAVGVAASLVRGSEEKLRRRPS